MLNLKRNRIAALILALTLTAISTNSPSIAFATVEGDQTPLTQEEIDEAILSGEIETSLPDNGIATYASRDYAVKTIGGSDRYQTSAAQALYAFPRSSWAIVASGSGYADSICAAGLAGALNCPVILTEPDQLTSCTSNALRQMGATNIIVLGSSTVVSDSTYAQIENLVGSNGSVERVWGIDRYETQMAVYQYGLDHNLWSGDTAVVASATDFADALSISPVSYKLKAPVFFADASKTLPSAQMEAIKSCGKTKFLLTGSTVVTSSNLENSLKSFGSVKRLGGSDRYATSQAISNYAVSNLGMSWNGVAFTSGLAPYDALGGGAVQGLENSVLCLKEEENYQTATLPFSGKPSSMKFFGDKAIYSSAFKTRCALKAGFKLSDIEGLVVYIDAGHGGSDPGASGCGYQEANLTRELATKVSNELNATYGVKTYVNTKGNSYKLRHPEAKAMDCGVLVSIHFNASGGSGTESYVHSVHSAIGSRTLQNSTHTSLVSALRLPDRGQKAEQFAVVSGPLPSVLLEICFIDRQSDMNQYQANKDAVARSIAQGIANA